MRVHIRKQLALSKKSITCAVNLLLSLIKLMRLLARPIPHRRLSSLHNDAELHFCVFALV